MVGMRALGVVCNDPQRGSLAIHALGPLVILPEHADAIGVASLVDGAALLSRLPAIPAGAGLSDAVGQIKGRCSVVQVRVHDELRPRGADGTANLGPFRARSYAAAVVGGPQDADEASSSRERLLATVPEFLRRFVGGQSEAEALFLAILARVHAKGSLDAPHQNGAELAAATREVLEQAGGRRHVVMTNGVELVHAASGIPSALVVLAGLSESLAQRIDPSLADSSMGRERLRRFRGVLSLGALQTPLKASAPVPEGASLQVLPDSALALVQRDLTVRVL